MGKITKRERKFAAKGGVKAGLEKGTITNKGRFKKKRKGSKQQQSGDKGDADAAHALKLQQQRTKERDDKDFVGKANLGLMNVEDFFSSFQDEVENEDDNSDNSSSSDDNDGDDEDISKEVVQKSEKVKAEKTKEKKKKVENSKKSKKEEDDDDDDDDSDADDGDSKSSASSSSDEDEDISDVEEQMKAEMEKLEKTDPEFHEYLQENEQELLEFGQPEGDEDEDGDDDDHDDNDDEDENKEANKSDDKAATKRKLLTGKLLRSLQNGAFQLHGLNSLKKIIRAYKSACHMGEAADGADSKNIHDTTLYYQIDSSEVFDQLMVTCLTEFHTALSFHLLEESEDEKKTKKTSEDEEEIEDPTDVISKIDDDQLDKPLDATVLERADRWYDIQPILQSFLKSTIHLLSESKEPKLWTYILKALSKYMRFVTPFPRIAEQLLKQLVDLWSAPYSSSESSAGDYQLVRLHAFLRIRQLAVTQPFPFIEECLKKTYLAYARRAKFGNSLSTSEDEDGAATLVFLGNCLVELYSLDLISSYQHAFIYIRQLALLIRAAMHKKTKEAFQQVYCWQFVQCLKLWTAVLASVTTKDPSDTTDNERDTSLVKSLIFPLSEIIIGMVRLVPAPARHLPLRFHCVRMLQQLAASAEVYIPTSALLLEALDHREFYSKPKKIKGRSNTSQGGIQLAYILKLPNKDDPLRTMEEQDACISCFFQLLNREIDLYRFSAGFPEYVIYIGQRLRKFSKETRNSRWRAYARGSLDQCDRYSKWAVQERSKLTIAPKDVPNLEVLLPRGGKTMRERFEAQVAKEQQQQQQAAAATAASKQSTNKRKQEDDDAESDEAKTTKKKRKNAKTVTNGKATRAAATSLDEKEVMEMEDTVEEGINWSDDEA